MDSPTGTPNTAPTSTNPGTAQPTGASAPVQESLPQHALPSYLDAHHVGPEVRQQHAAERPRPDAGELDDLQTRKRSTAHDVFPLVWSRARAGDAWSGKRAIFEAVEDAGHKDSALVDTVLNHIGRAAERHEELSRAGTIAGEASLAEVA